jgi:hypothetical protein
VFDHSGTSKEAQASQEKILEKEREQKKTVNA